MITLKMSSLITFNKFFIIVLLFSSISYGAVKVSEVRLAKKEKELTIQAKLQGYEAHYFKSQLTIKGFDKLPTDEKLIELMKLDYFKEFVKNSSANEIVDNIGFYKDDLKNILSENKECLYELKTRIKQEPETPNDLKCIKLFDGYELSEDIIKARLSEIKAIEYIFKNELLI